MSKNLRLKRTLFALILFTILNIVLLPNLNAQEKEWLTKKDSLFVLDTSTHFNLYTINGELSSTDKIDILQKRELA